MFSVLRFYVDILKLDNLWRFAGLVKLQLDNNIIEKIEGLGFLVNLQWLGRYFHHVYLTGRAINCFNILSENFSGVVNTYIVSINEDDFPSHKSKSQNSVMNYFTCIEFQWKGGSTNFLSIPNFKLKE